MPDEQPTTPQEPHSPAHRRTLPSWLLTVASTAFMPLFFMIVLTPSSAPSTHPDPTTCRWSSPVRRP